MSGPSESTLTRVILVALQRAGCYAMRNAQSTSRTRGHTGLPKGSADIVAIVAGRWVCLEVKLPGEKADPHQAAWLAQMQREGAYCAVVTSVGEALTALAEVRGVGRKSA